MVHTADLGLPAFTVQEVAASIGESEFVVYRLIKRGELACVRDVSGRYRVPYGELYAYLRERELEASVTDGLALVTE